MTNKTILEEVRGTITNVYSYPVTKEENEILTPKGIVIEPDEPEHGTICESFIGRDYSKYSVGQRVVHVKYKYKRPATPEDRRRYASIRKSCPDMVEDFENITYDEYEYDQMKESVKTL